MNFQYLFFIALLFALIAINPTRSYAQFADNNIQIPAKRTYNMSSRSVLSNTTPSTPAPFAFEARTIEAGTYLNHKIMYSPGPALTQAVETQINTLSFRPASHAGIATTS